jgi:hypothetical protein
VELLQHINASPFSLLHKFPQLQSLQFAVMDDYLLPQPDTYLNGWYLTIEAIPSISYIIKAL